MAGGEVASELDRDFCEGKTMREAVAVAPVEHHVVVACPADREEPDGSFGEGLVALQRSLVDDQLRWSVLLVVGACQHSDRRGNSGYHQDRQWPPAIHGSTVRP